MEALLRRLALLALVTLPGQAHVGDLFGGTDVLLPDGADGHGLAAAWGVLWADDGADAEFLCHQVLMGPEAFEPPAWFTDGRGTWLGVVLNHEVAITPGKPVYRSTDGCTHTPVEGLDGLRLGGMTFVPGAPGVAVATTADLGEAPDNRVFRSTDGGASWAPVDGFAPTAHLLRDLRGRPGALWMTEVALDPAEATVWRSLDDGLTWTGVDRPLRDADALGGRADFLDVIAADPADDDRAWFVQGPIGGPDRILVTDDAGVTVDTVADLPGDLLDAAVDDDGGLWLCLLDGSVWHAPDGTAAAPREDAPRCLSIASRPGELVVVTADNPTTGEIRVCRDAGGTWVAGEVLLDQIVGPRDCPAGAPATETCQAAWDDLLDRLAEPHDTGDPPDPDDPEPPDEGRCGPALPVSGLATLLVLPFLVRRRRR